MSICLLCGKEKPLTKHHPIPKSVIKKINPNSILKNKTFALCDECHNEVHFSFLLHLIMSHKIDGVNRYKSVKYDVLYLFLKDYPETKKAWISFWNKLLEYEMEQFEKETNIKEEQVIVDNVIVAGYDEDDEDTNEDN